MTVELKDGPGNDFSVFQKAVGSLKELVEDFPQVLVHCHAGRSRSAVVVAAYLMQSLHLNPEEAEAMVKAKRDINIMPELRVLLSLFER